MVGNPQKHIVVRLVGSSRQLAAFYKDQPAADVVEALSMMAGRGTLAREGGLDIAGDEPKLAAGVYIFRRAIMAGGLAGRAMNIQRLAVKAAQHPGSRWEDADHLLCETFGASVEAQLKRSQAQAAPPSFPFLRREREVRAFVEDLRHLHGYHRSGNTSADIDVPPFASDFSAQYIRAPHMQLFLGPPGVGKTTLLQNLERCIIKELDADPDWLHGSNSFRESLKSSMGAPIPFVFKLDLSVHVGNEFEGNELLQALGIQQSETLLALLMLMCVARAIHHPDISGLASLVDQLPDELLAILQPEHVARFVHKHLPRTNNIGSTQIFAFDEASSLEGRARQLVRRALQKLVVCKQQLPTPIFFTILLLSKHWGRMSGGGGRDIEGEDALWHWWPTPHGTRLAKAVHIQPLSDVPVPTGVKDKAILKQKAVKNAQRRQDKKARKAQQADAEQAAQPQTEPKKSAKKSSKKRARGEAAACDSGDTGITVEHDFHGQEADEDAQDTEARVAKEAQAEQPARQEIREMKTGNKRKKKRARSQAATSES